MHSALQCIMLSRPECCNDQAYALALSGNMWFVTHGQLPVIDMLVVLVTACVWRFAANLVGHVGLLCRRFFASVYQLFVNLFTILGEGTNPTAERFLAYTSM